MGRKAMIDLEEAKALHDGPLTRPEYNELVGLKGLERDPSSGEKVLRRALEVRLNVWGVPTARERRNA
jgi:hypothetical protein